MLIGGEFSSKAAKLLKLLADESAGEAGIRVEVVKLADSLNLDKTEIKNLLGYLESKEFLEVGSIGGPYLYGHIRITPRGLDRVSKL